MSGNIEGHWHPSKRPSRSDLLASNATTSFDPAEVDSAIETVATKPLILAYGEDEIMPSPKKIQPTPADSAVSTNDDDIDEKNLAASVETSIPASRDSALATIDNSLSESLLTASKPTSLNSEELVKHIDNNKIESNSTSLETSKYSTSASNFGHHNSASIDVIDLTGEDAAANDKSITTSSLKSMEHKEPKHNPSIEEIAPDSDFGHSQTFSANLVKEEDFSVSDELVIFDNDSNDNKFAFAQKSEVAAMASCDSPTVDYESFENDKTTTSTNDYHENIAPAHQESLKTVQKNSVYESLEEPVKCFVEETVEPLEKPVEESVKEPLDSGDQFIDEENLTEKENTTFDKEESAESVFEKLSESTIHQTMDSNIEEPSVSIYTLSDQNQTNNSELHEPIEPIESIEPTEPIFESSGLVTKTVANYEPEESNSERSELAQNATLEKITTHTVEAVSPVVDLDSRPVELFAKSKSEKTKNKHEENIFANDNDDAHDSFFNEIGQSQNNHDDQGISFQSNEDDFFSKPKDSSVPDADENVSFPKRSDKADSFATLFEKDEDDFLAEMPSKPRVRSHKRDPSFFANSSTDDPFFSNLGSKDNASDLSTSFGINTEPKAVEGTEKPKEPAPKADLSKSLAFLLEDDDELLPDDYVEPTKSKVAASAVPQPSSTQDNISLNRQASFANIFPGAPLSQPQPLQQTKAVSTATKAQGNNAFDLPTDMVPKIVRRVGSFQNTQFPPPTSYGMQSVNTSPRPSLSSKKSFFEDLPPIPKKPMSRKASAINLLQQGHPPGAGVLGGTPTGYSVGPPAGPPVSNRMPFVPPKAQTFNSSADSLPPQYPSSSPGSVYKAPAQVSRMSSPYNPYEPPVAPLSNPYEPSVASPSNPYAPQNETQVPLLPPQPPFSPKSNNQALNNSQPGSQVFPVSVPSQYSPRHGSQAPVMSPPNQQYMPQTSPYQSRANSSVGFHQHSSYAPPAQSTPPPVLQPAANLTSHGSFGDLPSNTVPKPNPYGSSGNLTGLNSNFSPTSRSDSTGNIYNGLKMSPQRPSTQNNTTAYSPDISDIISAHPVPINNETLLRRQFPIFRWGSTGKAVSVIPPQIAFGGTSTNIEIKIAPVNQIVTSDPNLSKFPFGIVGSKGALKNKKKDLEKWIEDYIGENEENGKAFGNKTTRSSDRITLWKILLALLKSGSSVTNPSKELTDSVRTILDPFVQAQESPDLNSFAPAVDLYQKGTGQLTASALGNNSNQGVKSDNVNRLADYIKVGQREDALKYALDQRLWAHSLILASSLGPTQWLNTVSEFVREEIRPLPLQSARDLALMYRVFSGAGADSGKFFLVFF